MISIAWALTEGFFNRAVTEDTILDSDSQVGVRANAFWILKKARELRSQLGNTFCLECIS